MIDLYSSHLRCGPVTDGERRDLACILANNPPRFPKTVRDIVDRVRISLIGLERRARRDEEGSESMRAEGEELFASPRFARGPCIVKDLRVS